MEPPIISFEPPPPQKRGSRWNVLFGVAAGLLFELAGYLILRGDQTAYGWSMFVIVPTFMGFAVALFTERQWVTYFAVFVTIILGELLLIAVNLEGWICCVLSTPLLFLFAMVGVYLGQRVRKYIFKKNVEFLLKFLMLCGAASFVLGAKSVEKPYLNSRVEMFNSSVVVPVSPAKAWDLIKSIEHVETHKPLLLEMGLPVPQSCTLDKEAIGGQRVCYFNQGMIAQEITEWNPSRFMKTKITKSTLPGRHWLKFVDASYEFIPQGSNTLVIRTTTISSRLYPRWYWRQFEEWGVRSEHEYVLADLLRRARIEAKLPLDQ